MTLDQMAMKREREDRHLQAVRKRAHQARRAQEQRTMAILEAGAAGHSKAAIARAAGVSRGRVSQIIKAHQLQMEGGN